MERVLEELIDHSYASSLSCLFSLRATSGDMAFTAPEQVFLSG
jgi:hypothetical protein